MKSILDFFRSFWESFKGWFTEGKADYKDTKVYQKSGHASKIEATKQIKAKRIKKAKLVDKNGMPYTRAELIEKEVKRVRKRTGKHFVRHMLSPKFQY